MPAKSLARGLLADFRPCARHLVRPGLFPCADLAPSTIPDGLRGKGWQAHRVEAYRTVRCPHRTPPSWSGWRGRCGDLHGLSSARAYAALRTPDGSPEPVPPAVICIGPTTAESARGLGMTGVAEAPGAGTGDIVEALVLRLTDAGP